jgi:hypothetical protein
MTHKKESENEVFKKYPGFASGFNLFYRLYPDAAGIQQYIRISGA